MFNKYLLTFTDVGDVVTVTINGESLNISAFTSPKKYERDVSGFVNSGINTLTIVAQNRTRQAVCVGAITKNGRIIHSWNVNPQNGTTQDNSFLDESFEFVD